MWRSLPIYVAAGVLFAPLAMPSAALACDMHGGSFGSMHRFNPFARTFPQAPQGAAERPNKEADAGQSARREQAQDASRQSSQTYEGQSRASDERDGKGRRAPLPPREWERDYGNGTISEADKAIFT